MAILANDVEIGQAVIYYSTGSIKIMVRGDDKKRSLIPFKIPFCEIGIIKNEKFLFHSTPVDIVFLPENQVFDLTQCSIKD